MEFLAKYMDDKHEQLKATCRHQVQRLMDQQNTRSVSPEDWKEIFDALYDEGVIRSVHGA